MKNFWIFFAASILSLIGSNYFIFTQGWYLLYLTGSKTSVGTSWCIFFVPALLFLPLIGSLLDGPNLKKVLMRVEFAKIIIFVSFAVLLKLKPTTTLVYLMSGLYGIFFAMYFPSVYVLLKRLVPANQQTKYSHLTEASLQISNIVGVFSSGFLFQAIGFENLLLLSAGAVGLGLLGLRTLKFEVIGQTSSKKQSLFSGYKKVFGLLLGQSPETKRLDQKTTTFGFFHMFPHAIIMVSNVPLILYVSDIMHKGVREFGVIDALIGLAALGASLLWSRLHSLSERKDVYVALSLISGAVCMAALLVSPEGVSPYVWIFVFGATLVSSKVIARANLVRMVSKEQMGSYSSLFQTVGNAVMLALFALVSMLSHTFDARNLFAILGVAMLGYAIFLVKYYSPGKPSPS